MLSLWYLLEKSLCILLVPWLLHLPEDAFLDCLALVDGGSCICGFHGTVANKEIVLNPAISPGLNAKGAHRPSLPQKEVYLHTLKVAA